MKTSELTGENLDHAVALANGWELENYGWWKIERGPNGGQLCYAQGHKGEYQPSKKWEQGGPLLETYAVGVIAISDAEWAAVEQITHCHGRGKTYLEAGMRCYVASILGEDVDIPNDAA